MTTSDFKVAVWAEPQERLDMHLMPSNIEKALAWFKDKAGQEARLIMVHPNNEGLAKQNSNDIKVATMGGILASEVWLSSSDNFVTPSPARDFLTSQIEDERYKIETRPRIPVGRPCSDLPMEKILALHSEGLGARAIAKRLSDEGINVSYITVHRALKKARQQRQ